MEAHQLDGHLLSQGIAEYHSEVWQLLTILSLDALKVFIAHINRKVLHFLGVKPRKIMLNEVAKAVEVWRVGITATFEKVRRSLLTHLVVESNGFYLLKMLLLLLDLFDEFLILK